jgi:tRNA pseudouridine55 synthase
LVGKREKRRISGVLLLDKPIGVTSNGALQHAKRLYRAAKAGHTGNLDPIATGLLPICFGEATKFSQFLIDADKSYEAVIRLGETTDTGDSEGQLLERCIVAVSQTQVEAVLCGFIGKIQQIPPMYSALKHQGRPLYEYARNGVNIERTPRQVHIYRLKAERLAGDELALSVDCSKGTYIRVLAEDIGRELGCGAHIVALRRTRVAGFSIDNSVTLETLEALDTAGRDHLLLSPDALVAEFPRIDLDRDSAFYMRHGQAIWRPRLAVAKLYRVYDEKQMFIGVAQVTDDGKLNPKRLVVSSSEAED